MNHKLYSASETLPVLSHHEMRLPPLALSGGNYTSVRGKDYAERVVVGFQVH